MAVKKTERTGEEIKLPSGRVAVMEECRGSDEDVLNNQKRLKKGDAFDVVLLRRLISLDGKPVGQEDLDGLVHGDYLELLLAMRKSLYGETVELEMRCGNCGEKSDWKINLDEIPRRPYPDNDELEVELPSKRKAMIKHTLHRDERKLLGREDITLSELMMMRVKSVDAQPAGLKTLQEMTGPDRRVLREKMMEFTFGPDTEARFCCPSCNQDLVTRLEIESEFFFPKAR
jgi:hypothetical protein